VNATSPYTETARQFSSFLGLDLPALTGSILVVEDENFVREVTAEILQAAGYAVLKARNAAEALTVFSENQDCIALVVLDVVLPGRSGRDLARELTHLHPGLKILFMSGYPENAITKDKVIRGKSTYLPKPFSVDGLMRKVRDAILLKE
jgi:DNA-binding NtrC family response regulator